MRGDTARGQSAVYLLRLAYQIRFSTPTCLQDEDRNKRAENVVPSWTELNRSWARTGKCSGWRPTHRQPMPLQQMQLPSCPHNQGESAMRLEQPRCDACCTFLALPHHFCLPRHIHFCLAEAEFQLFERLDKELPVSTCLRAAPCLPCLPSPHWL